MSFTRMDQIQAEDVKIIGDALTHRQALLPQIVKAMLRQLEDQVDGFPVNELVHSLQTATHALRAGASEELVVAALCHDVGKAISVLNHSGITAEILKSYVSEETYEIIRTHTIFQARYFNELVGKDPVLRRQYADRPWYNLACRFSDEWDQTSFDPDYDTLPLEYFEPMLDRMFAQPKDGMV